MSKSGQFNTYAIDQKIIKEKIYQNGENIFTFLPNFKEVNECKNHNLPKYFVKLTDEQKKKVYIGILTDSLKRDKFGYIEYENEDYYLGEIKIDAKHGFGIYKHKKDESNYDMYIGEFNNNERKGEGILINCFETNNYNCHMGLFEKELIKASKVYTIKDGEESLFIGEIDHQGNSIGTEGYILQGNITKRNYTICKGKFKDKILIEGRSVFLNEKDEKIKGFYFKKKDNLINDYDFEYWKDKDEDDLLIEYFQNSKYKSFKDILFKVKDQIDEFIKKLISFDGKQINDDFEKTKDDLKKNIAILNRKEK